MEPDQNKVFVGGIAWETSESRLKEYFQAFGDVVQAVVMKDKVTGRARGFGFVEFADASVAEKVINEKHTLDGRTVEVKKAVRREEHHGHTRSSSAGSSSPYGNPPRTKKIFVGGLASSVTEEDFKNYFEQFGTITDAVVMYDHSTQRPRGFGFITFDSEDAVERAVQKNFLELHDKTVEVKKAVPKEVSARFGPGRGAPYGQSNTGSPVPGYGGPAYLPSPGGARGSFPPYGPPMYGAPGYGPPGMGYGVAMNGGFGGPSYAGGPYPGGYAVGYGGAPNYVGVPPSYGSSGPAASPGYGGAPAGLRSPWGHASSGYAGAASPAYGTGGTTGVGAYGNAGWRPGSTSGQSPTVSGYNNNKGYNAGYNDTAYNSIAGGYSGRNSTGGQAGYGDAYAASSPYGDSSWRPGDRSSPAAPSPSASGAGTDSVGYGVTGRQPQRGSDARFRPYPASAADRVP